MVLPCVDVLFCVEVLLRVSASPCENALLGTEVGCWVTVKLALSCRLSPEMERMMN